MKLHNWQVGKNNFVSTFTHCRLFAVFFYLCLICQLSFLPVCVTCLHPTSCLPVCLSVHPTCFYTSAPQSQQPRNQSGWDSNWEKTKIPRPSKEDKEMMPTDNLRTHLISVELVKTHVCTAMYMQMHALTKNTLPQRLDCALSHFNNTRFCDVELGSVAPASTTVCLFVCVCSSAW